MPHFQYADIHCHPNLKTFGHSFENSRHPKSDMWHTVLPSFLTRKIHSYTGITKFSQTDFSTMTRAKTKIAFVSLYPFEKGFFINKKLWPSLAAHLANWGIEIGYKRVRHIQQHTDYFSDLLSEYAFVIDNKKEQRVDGIVSRWELTKNWSDIDRLLTEENKIAVVLSIEGSHVFNTGLSDFGALYTDQEILSNIQVVKNLEYAPLFMGLAHNFNNDLCGHAKSLQRLGPLVDQSKNIDKGISELGLKVIHALLCNTTGRTIYIDLKHMSLAARLEYYLLLRSDYHSRKIPLIVSHGAVTGLPLNGTTRKTNCQNVFNTNDINFYDEEIIEIVKSEGLFGIQMDMGINADLQKIKNYKRENNQAPIAKRSAWIIWNQLQYIAEVCDENGLYAWGAACIGSDFDGSINPFPDLLTAEGFETLANELVILASQFLKTNTLSLPENRLANPEEIIERFMLTNTVDFLRKFY